MTINGELMLEWKLIEERKHFNRWKTVNIPRSTWGYDRNYYEHFPKNVNPNKKKYIRLNDDGRLLIANE